MDSKCSLHAIYFLYTNMFSDDIKYGIYACNKYTGAWEKMFNKRFFINISVVVLYFNEIILFALLGIQVIHYTALNEINSNYTIVLLNIMDINPIIWIRIFEWVRVGEYSHLLSICNGLGWRWVRLNVFPDKLSLQFNSCLCSKFV